MECSGCAASVLLGRKYEREDLKGKYKKETFKINYFLIEHLRPEVCRSMGVLLFFLLKIN